MTQNSDSATRVNDRVMGRMSPNGRPYQECAVNACENEAYPIGSPVRLWIVDTHPPEHMSLHFVLCNEHARKASWSI